MQQHRVQHLGVKQFATLHCGTQESIGPLRQGLGNAEPVTAGYGTANGSGGRETSAPVRGMVITDYGTSSYMMTDQMIRAGGDLALYQGRYPSTSGDLYTPSHRAAMRQAAKNILYTVVNSNAMNGMGEGIIYRYAMPYWLIILIVVIVAVAVVFAAWGFFAIRKSYRKVKALNGENKPSGENK